MRAAVVAALLSGCILPTPKPGTCECVCAWRRPTGETGRFLVVVDADGGVLR